MRNGDAGRSEEQKIVFLCKAVAGSKLIQNFITFRASFSFYELKFWSFSYRFLINLVYCFTYQMRFHFHVPNRKPDCPLYIYTKQLGDYKMSEASELAVKHLPAQLAELPLLTRKIRLLWSEWFTNPPAAHQNISSFSRDPNICRQKVESQICSQYMGKSLRWGCQTCMYRWNPQKNSCTEYRRKTKTK